MATAQDYNAVSRGLDSITQAVLGNFMARRAREQQEEEQRRFDQQRADQLAAEVAMRQLRERQMKLAEDQAKAQAEARAATAAIQKETLAQRNRAGLEKTQAAADAAGLQRAFMGQFNGDATAEPVNYDEAIGATAAPRLDITKPEDVLRAAQRVPGAMTPQQLAEIALRNQVATAKAAPEAAKNIEPVMKDYDVGNGQKLKVLYNPATGAHTLVKDPVQNKVAIRDVLAVRSALQKNTARMQELLAVPPENFGLPERREYKSLQEDNTFLNNLIGPVIEGEGVTPGKPDQSGGATNMMPPGAPKVAPAMKFDIAPDGKAVPTGGAAVAPAATPPDDRTGIVPSVGMPAQDSTPAGAVPTPRPSPARLVSESIGDLSDEDFTRTVRSLPPDEAASVSEALLEAIVRKLGIQPRGEHLRIGESRLFQDPTSYVESLVNKPEFTAYWQSLPPDERSALLKSALVGGRVTNPRPGLTVLRMPNYQ